MFMLTHNGHCGWHKKKIWLIWFWRLRTLKLNAWIHGYIGTAALELAVSVGSCGSAGSSKCHSSTYASLKKCKCEPGNPCRVEALWDGFQVAEFLSTECLVSLLGQRCRGGSGVVFHRDGGAGGDWGSQTGGTHGGRLLSDPRGSTHCCWEQEAEILVELQCKTQVSSGFIQTIMPCHLQSGIL